MLGKEEEKRHKIGRKRQQAGSCKRLRREGKAAAAVLRSIGGKRLPANSLHTHELAKTEESTAPAGVADSTDSERVQLLFLLLREKQS